MHFRFLLIVLIAFLFSCGGDEGVVDETSAQVDEPSTPVLDKPEVAEVEEFVEEEPEEIPDPNGVYLPLSEEQNGKPVYSNGNGFFLWFNGSTWKITDKIGSGKAIATGQESINDKWSDGGKARHYPHEEYSKDALFRLAVAYQGSQDNGNAIRLFNQFVKQFPEDKMVPEAYLSMGDLSTSGLQPDEQPSVDQINQARENYSFVREKTQDVRLITDATFNEGGLIERVAENPEGVVEYYLSFDKNKDDLLQAQEYAAIGIESTKSFSDFDMNEDKAIDYGEMFDVATWVFYSGMEKLFREYSENNAGKDGSRTSEATEKIGFASEKLGNPAMMLNLYYKDIEDYGSQKNNVGVDGLIVKYIDKFQEYDLLYGRTLDLLEKIQSPSEIVSFTFRDRRGSEKSITGSVEEIIKDRNKLLPFLATSYAGLDPDVQSDLVSMKGAVLTNPKHASKFKGYLKKYQVLKRSFPSDLSPLSAFTNLLDKAKSSGEKALELRMLSALDSLGERSASAYTPQRSDFPQASPGVLVWMAKKFIAQNSSEDAIVAMNILLDQFSVNGGDFIFDAHYIIGMAKQQSRDYPEAVASFASALTNSSWHPSANDARIRQGESMLEVGKSSRDATYLETAEELLSEVRGDTEATVEQRAQSSHLMGECKRALKDYAGAAYYFKYTTLNFPASTKWAPKSFEQAMSCFDQTGDSEQRTQMEKAFVNWQRNYLK
ncbi:tetratricopeptide repeat protein [Opitutales bacterium]|nr:tetratricopeptide repeat protein [Opitutales bacterium]